MTDKLFAVIFDVQEQTQSRNECRWSLAQPSCSHVRLINPLSYIVMWCGFFFFFLLNLDRLFLLGQFGRGRLTWQSAESLSQSNVHWQHKHSASHICIIFVYLFYLYGQLIQFPQISGIQDSKSLVMYNSNIHVCLMVINTNKIDWYCFNLTCGVSFYESGL